MIKTECVESAGRGAPIQKLPIGFRAAARQGSQVALFGAMILLSYVLASRFVLQSVRVVGNSMVPTLHDSERYLLNRWIYHVRNPDRSEIVVIRDPADGGFSVKRVIAVEGDTIALKGGQVYLNGKLLEESYLAPNTSTFNGVYKSELTLKLQGGQFFLLGDNRRNSVDSRSYGLVSRDNILGMLIQ